MNLESTSYQQGSWDGLKLAQWTAWEGSTTSIQGVRTQQFVSAAGGIAPADVFLLGLGDMFNIAAVTEEPDGQASLSAVVGLFRWADTIDKATNLQTPDGYQVWLPSYAWE